jgi:hypothetical protein
VGKSLTREERKQKHFDGSNRGFRGDKTTNKRFGFLTEERFEEKSINGKSLNRKAS